MARSGAADSARYTVKSLSNAIDIMEHLERAPDEGLGVSEIAELSGLSKSAAFAILQTLRERGLVADIGVGQSRRYRLGIALSRMGERVRSQLSVRDVALPILRRLADEAGMPARLAVFEGRYAVAVEQVNATKTVQVDLRMRAHETLHNTGLGKAILAHLSEDEVRRVLGTVPLAADTPYTITDIDKLLHHLREVRRVGYAIDDEESVEGIFCIGSGVLDHTGRCTAAVSITGLKTGVMTRRYQDLGQATRTAAEELSAQLGWNGSENG